MLHLTKVSTLFAVLVSELLCRYLTHEPFLSCLGQRTSVCHDCLDPEAMSTTQARARMSCRDENLQYYSPRTNTKPCTDAGAAPDPFHIDDIVNTQGRSETLGTRTPQDTSNEVSKTCTCGIRKGWTETEVGKCGKAVWDASRQRRNRE